MRKGVYIYTNSIHGIFLRISAKHRYSSFNDCFLKSKVFLPKCPYNPILMYWWFKLVLHKSWFITCNLFYLSELEAYSNFIPWFQASNVQNERCRLWGRSKSDTTKVMQQQRQVLFWRRQWHPTPVLLPGKSHGWRSLVSMGSLRVGHNSATSLSLFTFMH